MKTSVHILFIAFHLKSPLNTRKKLFILLFEAVTILQIPMEIHPVIIIGIPTIPRWKQDMRKKVAFVLEFKFKDPDQPSCPLIKVHISIANGTQENDVVAYLVPWVGWESPLTQGQSETQAYNTAAIATCLIHTLVEFKEGFLEASK